MLKTIYLKSLTLTLLLSPVLCNSQMCEQDEQNIGNDSVIWPATESCTLSKPLCILKNLETASRNCCEGQWENKPDCIYIQREPPTCQNNLQYLEFEETDICYEILPAAPFSEKCSFPETYPMHIIEQLLGDITTDFVWFPVKRDDTYGLGKYYMIEPSENYGVVVEKDMKYENSIVDKQCTVYNYKQKEYKIVNCNDTYPKLCLYYNEKSLNIFSRERCMKCNYNMNSSWCCIERKEFGTPRHEFCKGLVELKQPYQNKILQQLLEEEECWIGLEKVTDTYVWSNSLTQPNYTYWSPDNIFSNYFVGMSKDGWVSYPDTSLQCAICERQINFTKPKLTLMYNKSEELLILEVIGHANLKVLTWHSSVSCFFKTPLYFNTRLTELEVGIENDIAQYIYKPSTTGPGYYWCTGFRYPEIELVKSNEILLYDRSIYANEYTATVTISYKEGVNPLSAKAYTSFLNIAKRHLEIYPIVVSFRLFAVLNVNETYRNIQLLTHITTKYTSNFYEEYLLLLGALEFIVNQTNDRLDEFLCVNYCYENSLVIGNITLNWPVVSAGTTIVSLEFCLQEDDTPVLRTCQEDFMQGARWSDVEGNCFKYASKSNITVELQHLLEGNIPIEETLQNLTAITESYEEFVKIDVYLIGMLLEKMTLYNSIDLENVTKVVSNVMKSDSNLLVEVQITMNATDKILQNYDKILENSITTQNDSYKLFKTDNIILLTVNVQQSNISGLALLKKNNSTEVEILNSNLQLEDIIQNKNLEAAIFLDSTLIDQIRNTSIRQQLIIVLFAHDSLFNEEKLDHILITEEAFGVLIPEFYEIFAAPVSTFFKTNAISTDFDKSCAHWQFSLKDESYSRSHWKENSGNITFIEQNNVISCDFSHLTHFGLLMVDKKQLDDANLDKFNTYGFINSILSLFGSCVIFLTAILFKSWRSSGNKVLLNFVFANTLKITMYFISISIESLANGVCIVIGSLLHYSSLAEFCWMFVISILQYRRLVKVFNNQTKNLLLKTCIVGWILPLLPVLLLLSIEPNNYTIKDTGICYPQGIYFYITILTPIAIILSGNIIIFFVIFYNICCKPRECVKTTSSDFLYRWKTIILLFFMLGLPFAFTFVSTLFSEWWLLDVFNFLVTSQGFVIFLYFIVFNKSTRMLYANWLKRSYNRIYY